MQKPTTPAFHLSCQPGPLPPASRPLSLHPAFPAFPFFLAPNLHFPSRPSLPSPQPTFCSPPPHLPYLPYPALSSAPPTSTPHPPQELILFSAVRSGSRSMGFVADERRLNVLLTRARRGLVVVGDPKTLVNSRHWADWLAWVEEVGVVYDSPRWRMPERPRARVRPDSDDEDFRAWGERGT